jgi:hypothetical protein
LQLDSGAGPFAWLSTFDLVVCLDSSGKLRCFCASQNQLCALRVILPTIGGGFGCLIQPAPMSADNCQRLDSS